MIRFRAFLVVAILVVGATVGLSLPAGSIFSERPAGVAADEWHPISETLGLVVRYASSERGERRLVGTLMVKEGRRWQPVIVNPPSAGMVPVR